MESLIYTDGNHVDIGVVGDFDIDIEFGPDSKNDFELSTATVIPDKAFVYMDGTEYGGVIDKVSTDSGSEVRTYHGRTWHGILKHSVIRPEPNDHFVVSGDVGAVISTVISKVGLASIFSSRTSSSGISVTNYKFARYCTVYDGLLDMLESVGAKLRMSREGGRTVLWAEPIETVRDKADSDVMNFKVTRNYRVVNHLVCIGVGELEGRTVIDFYADGDGNVSKSRTFSGLEELADVYDYTNADAERLDEYGRKKLKDMQADGEVEITDISDELDLCINDLLEARDNNNGITASCKISQIVVKATDGAMTVSYGVSGVSTKGSFNDVASVDLSHITYRGGNGITINSSNEVSVNTLTTDEIDEITG